MAFRNISVLLTANDAQLVSSMRRSSASVDEFGRRTTTAGRNVTRAGNEMTTSISKLENVLQRVSGRALANFAIRALGVYAAGRAVNQALQAVVGGAVQFDARMRNVNSISGLTERQLSGLGSQVISLSRQLPQSANNLAEGLYDIASSGFQGAAGVEVLTAAARAATAGLTDTATSAAAIAGVLNAYGEGAGQARSVSDSLFQTVNLGVLSFGDLAQGIGQVVGVASAAGVSIDEVGQAIATMTKGGIVPAEAFTSLNQLFAQIIQPSDALATVFKSLGYESGAAALQSKGLAGVMRDIQRVTGGNVTTLSQLFTDTRSLRGAFQLVAHEGRSYAAVIRDWGTAHKGAGATATALAEQLKSVSAQWQLFKNRIQAAAIETGTRALPALLALMRGAGELGHDVQQAGQRVAPFFHNLADAAVSTARVVGILASAVLPLARVLGIIATSAIVATLTALSAALAAATHFVEQHRSAQIALGLIITAQVLPALSALIVRMAWFSGNLVAAGILRIISAFTALGGGLAAARVAMSGFLSTSVSAGSVLGGVFAGAAIIAAVSLYKLQQASAHARDEVERLSAGFSANNYQSAMRSIDALSSAVQKATTHFQDLNQFQRGLGKFGFGPGANDVALMNQGADALGKQQDALLNTLRNANRLGDQFGVLGQTVLDYARKNNIDLSKPWDQSADAVQQVRERLTSLANEAGTSLPALTSMTDGSVDAMTALADAIKKAGDATASSFSNATDVLQQFDPAQAHQVVSDAQQKLLDAQRSLREEERQYNAEKKHSVSSDQQLAHAHRDVTDAAKGLADAQKQAAQSGDLGTIYRRNIDMARTFVSNIDEALRRGLDPAEVMRLLQAGPQQAGPLLNTLVHDHSNRLINLSNRSEQALERISEKAVRIAQFTATAINAPLNAQARLARELPKAFAIEELAGKGLSARQIEQRLGLTPRQITQIARDFGVTLPRAIQRELDNHPVHVRVTHPSSYATGRRTADDGRGYATGGRIDGPGTPTSDSIPLWASRDEWIINARAANFYGHGVMAALNKMTLPRFATGGMVGTARPVLGASGGPVVVRVVERPAQYVTRNEVNLHGPQFHDDRSWQSFEERQRVKATMP